MEKQTTKKNSKLFNIIIYSIAGLLMFGGLVILVAENSLVLQSLFSAPYEAPPTMPPRDLTPTDTPDDTPSLSISPSYTEQVAPEITPTPYAGVLEPVMIYFTKDNIQCPIQQVGLDDNGAIGTIDDALIAGWYNVSAVPGESGNSIISGHVRYGGVLGYFSVLQQSSIGDEIIVKLSDGSYRYFEVYDIQEYRHTVAPPDALKLSGETRLTLITCSGSYNSSEGTHENRLYVICRPIG